MWCDHTRKSKQTVWLLNWLPFLSVLLMHAVLPRCNAQRKWRGGSQLETNIMWVVNQLQIVFGKNMIKSSKIFSFVNFN